MKATVDGLIAVADGEQNAALHLWLEAADFVLETSSSEPLRAAAHNNAGIASLMASKRREAAAHLAEAERLWMESQAGIACLDVPIASRSSVFHLRLAMQHQEAFTELRRRRLFEACAAARAISERNAQLAAVDAAQYRDTLDADETIIGALEPAFGPNCADIRLLRDQSTVPSDSVRAAYRAKADYLARGAARSYVEGTGYWADIDCAAQMTVLLHPSLLPKGSAD